MGDAGQVGFRIGFKIGNKMFNNPAFIIGVEANNAKMTTMARVDTIFEGGCSGAGI